MENITSLLEQYEHTNSFRTLGEMIYLMEDGIVEFDYRKQNGEIRHAFGTLNPEIIAKVTGKDEDDCSVFNQFRGGFITNYFDLTSDAVRCFDSRRLQIPNPLVPTEESDRMKAALRTFVTAVANGTIDLDTSFAFTMHKKAWDALESFDSFASWVLEDGEFESVNGMIDYVYMELRDSAKCEEEC